MEDTVDAVPYLIGVKSYPSAFPMADLVVVIPPRERLITLAGYYNEFECDCGDEDCGYQSNEDFIEDEHYLVQMPMSLMVVRVEETNYAAQRSARRGDYEISKRFKVAPEYLMVMQDKIDISSSSTIAKASIYAPQIPNLYPEGNICMGNGGTGYIDYYAPVTSCVAEGINAYWHSEFNRDLSNPNVSSYLANWERDPSSLEKEPVGRSLNTWFGTLEISSIDPVPITDEVLFAANSMKTMLAGDINSLYGS